MTDLALRVENLSKRYRIGKSLARANGRASLLHKAAAPFAYLASTLLKILSRIIEPTSGRAILNGRVCSLLDASRDPRFHTKPRGGWEL